VVKSSLKAEKSLMKLGGKALKSKGDDALKLVDNKIDDVGRSLIDDTAGGAKQVEALTSGQQRVAKYGHLWQSADLNKAINRHAGPNATSWRTSSGKTIFENPASGRQVVVDDAGYFRIFQPKSIGSDQGKYLDLLGKIPSPAKIVRGNVIKNVPLYGDELNTITHFLIR
jgi:hypothetical protein